jgi:hypothetical protein
VIGLVLLASLVIGVPAGELKITESEDSIVAEYTGTPSSASDTDSPLAGGSPPVRKRSGNLRAGIEQLKKESEELLSFGGGETPDEIASRTLQAEEKKRRIEALEDEIRKLAENPAPEVREQVPTAEPPVSLQNRRQEMKRDVEVLQKLRRSSVAPPE